LLEAHNINTSTNAHNSACSPWEDEEAGLLKAINKTINNWRRLEFFYLELKGDWRGENVLSFRSYNNIVGASPQEILEVGG